MSGLPAEYYFHELKKLLGDYKPNAEMPCWRCHEPEAAAIAIRFALFGAAAHPRLPWGTAPALDAITDLASESEAEPPLHESEQLDDAEFDGRWREEVGWTEENEEAWRWSRAWQLWLPLPYPPGFLPAHCCARRSRLTLVASKE
jgi:hypothetical protein